VSKGAQWPIGSLPDLHIDPKCDECDAEDAESLSLEEARRCDSAV
jgi:hypothetical protein